MMKRFGSKLQTELRLWMQLISPPLFFLQWSDVSNCDEYPEILDLNLKESGKINLSAQKQMFLWIIIQSIPAAWSRKKNVCLCRRKIKVLWLGLPELWPKARRPPVGCKKKKRKKKKVVNAQIFGWTERFKNWNVLGSFNAYVAKLMWIEF